MTLALPGFADPVEGAQASFRAVLDAMSHPGSIHVAGSGLTVPEPLHLATAAVLLTLVDADTPLWLAAEFAPAADWLRFHCGATLVTDRAAASFVCAAEMPPLASLATGTDEEPETAATLILQIAAFGAGAALRLSGPGLAAPAPFAADLPPDFALAWAANHALYPRGVDLILCAGDRLAAFPRSLRIEEA